MGLVAPGLGRLKPDTTGSSHNGRPTSDFFSPSFLGVKAQSDTTAVKDNLI